MSFKEGLRKIKQDQITSELATQSEIEEPPRKMERSAAREIRNVLKSRARKHLKPILREFKNEYVGQEFRSKIKTYVTYIPDIISGKEKPQARVSLLWDEQNKGRTGNVLHLVLSDDMGISVQEGNFSTLTTTPVLSLIDEGWRGEVESKILDIAKTPRSFQFDLTPQPDYGPSGEASGTADLP